MSSRFTIYFFRVTYLALLSTLGLFLYSLYRRPIHVDAAILGEPTYWLAHDGILRSELQRGWQHAEEHFFFTHKLFLYVGSWWTELWGWSAVTLNSLSLVYLGALLGSWALIAKMGGLAWRWYAIFVLLLLTNHHIYELSFVYRPEIAVAAFSSWSFWFLQRFLQRKTLSDILIAGLLAGFGVGHHLNGVVIVIAGFSLLVFRKSYGAAAIFGLLGSLGLGYYFIDIRSLSDFQLMISQFQNMQDIRAEHASWSHYLLNIPEEQKRYLHSPVEISWTLLFLVTLFTRRHYLWKTQRNLVVYTMAGMASLALISHDKDTKYLALQIPFITFLTVLSLENIFSQSNKDAEGKFSDTRFFRVYLVPIVIFLFFVGEWRSNLQTTFEKENRLDSYGELAEGLPAGSKILGPVFAAFWALPHSYRLQSFIAYQVLASHGAFKMDAEHLARALDQFQIDAILLDEDSIVKFHLDNQSLSQFQTVRENPALELRFLKRRAPQK